MSTPPSEPRGPARRQARWWRLRSRFDRLIRLDWLIAVMFTIGLALLGSALGIVPDVAAEHWSATSGRRVWMVVFTCGAALFLLAGVLLWRHRTWVLHRRGTERPGLFEAPLPGKVGVTMPAPRRYPDELPERAVRLVFEMRRSTGQKQGAIARVADQLGVHRDALRRWVRQAEIDSASRPGTSSEDGSVSPNSSVRSANCVAPTTF